MRLSRSRTAVIRGGVSIAALLIGTPLFAQDAAPAAGEASSGGLVFGSPTTYTQPDGVFSLEPPAGWQADLSTSSR